MSFEKITVGDRGERHGDDRGSRRRRTEMKTESKMRKV
jgi:hypothetical protein